MLADNIHRNGKSRKKQHKIPQKKSFCGLLKTTKLIKSYTIILLKDVKCGELNQKISIATSDL